MRRCTAFFLLIPGALLAQGRDESVGRREQTLFITAPVTLDTTVPASFACRTSQSAVLHLDIVDEQQGVVFKSQDWGAEPNIPVSKRLEFGAKPHLKRNFTANLSVRYRGATGPSVAFGLGQGIDSAVLAPSVGRTGFIPNPARPPGGRFQLFLPAPASVLARIWAGGRQAGAPVFSSKLPDLPQGQNPIEWNLRNSRGGLVPTGRYMGRLDCSPVREGLHPVLYLVSFEVETESGH